MNGMLKCSVQVRYCAMNVTLVASLIAAFGALLVTIATYLFTKRNELEAALRKEKLEYYKTFVESISGIMEGEWSQEGQEAFSKACNNLQLFAPRRVIDALHEYQMEIHMSTPKRGRHDELFTNLMIAIRHDLGIKQADDHRFEARLMDAGTNRVNLDTKE